MTPHTDDFLPTEHRAWKALVYIAYAYAGEGEGKGVSRFTRIWARISNGHNSKTVRDNPINMVHFFY